ncbi:MAG: TetR/AcrR family transcriptional regulator [Leptolyngbyaceae cyanobacterium MO_188.B28]|nr:TetR/AcrR family transcriptional regulator [Leptolyngbyaceae cyanobacterium MO_188.B28]
MGPANNTHSDRQKSVEKTQAILEGAMAEFLAHGYAATSMDRVAATAGVSKATVYSHFQDKQRLFTALIQRLVSSKYKTIFGLESDQSLRGEPKVVLRTIAENMLDNIQQNPLLLSFMRVIVGESGRFPSLAQPYVQHMAKPVLELLSEYLGSRTELNLTDPEATARVFIGTLVYYVLLQEVMHGKEILPMERDRIVDTLVELIVR